MARVILRATDPLIEHFYVVDQPVGDGLPNVRDDVLLVQFLLAIAMQNGPAGNYVPPNEPPITIDGKFGPLTEAYIAYYQTEGNRRNPDMPTREDKRVDPLAGGRRYGAIYDRLYTILALNVTYKQIRGIEMHQDIRTDPLFPQELTTSLYIS